MLCVCVGGAEREATLTLQGLGSLCEEVGPTLALRMDRYELRRQGEVLARESLESTGDGGGGMWDVSGMRGAELCCSWVY